MGVPMKGLPLPAFVTLLVLVGALAALLPQDHASAIDSIDIRARVDEGGNVVIERDYAGQTSWVRVGVIVLDEPQPRDVFQYGAFTLAVEFIPETRLPLPQRDGYRTGYSTRVVSSTYAPCEWEETKWDENGKPIRWRCELTPIGSETAIAASCAWGWSAQLGPFDSLANGLGAGGFAMLICDHGRLLQGLESSSEMITLEELRAKVAEVLAAQGETRSLEDIPIIGTASNPIHSETTYVDIRVLQPVGSRDALSISVQARGGGDQEVLELDRSTRVAIYSLASR